MRLRAPAIPFLGATSAANPGAILLGAPLDLTESFRSGTREAPARVVPLGDTGYAQLRLEAPLVPLPGDHLIVRQLAPPDTVGGGPPKGPKIVMSSACVNPVPTPRPVRNVSASPSTARISR